MKNKKIISLALACLLICGALASCSSNTSSDTSSDSSAREEKIDECDNILTYHFNYDLSDYIKVPEYKGLSADSYDVTVTDEEIENNIYATRSYYAQTTEVTDRASEYGDTVNISYTAVESDGTEIETEDSVDIAIGTNSLTAAFDDSLTGHYAGDTYDVEITFPDPYEYSPDYSGVTATFSVTVNKVSETELPLWSDDFVRAYLGYDSVEAYTEYIRQYLTDYYTNQRDSYVISQLVAALMDETEVISYPSEYDELYNGILDAYEQAAENLGTDLNGYAVANFSMSEDDFLEYLTKSCQEEIKQEMLYYYIARAENITLTTDEYYERIEDYVTNNDCDSVEELEEKYSRASLCQQFMFDKVCELLMDDAVLTTD